MSLGSRRSVLTPMSWRRLSPCSEAAHASILAPEVEWIPRSETHLEAAVGGLEEAMMQWTRGTYSLGSLTLMMM